MTDGEWVGPILLGPAGVLGLIGLRLGICVLNRDYNVIQHFAGKSTVRDSASRGCPLTSDVAPVRLFIRSIPSCSVTFHCALIQLVLKNFSVKTTTLYESAL